MLNTSNTNSSIHSEEQWQYSTKFIFIVSMHLVNYLLGLPLNTYIIAMLLNGCRRLDPCDVFTLNQAVAEIFFMLLAPFHILLIVSSDMRFNQPLGFLLGSGMSVRAILQCWVCFERYVAVVHPITFLKFRPLPYRMVMCVMAWLGGIPAGIICLITFPYMPYQLFGVIYFIILSINIISYVSILKKLKHPGPGERNADRRMEDGAKKRAFQVVRMNLLTFLVQNTPIAVLFGTLNTLPITVFRMASDICLAFNLAMALVQAVFVLHKAGKFL